MLTPEETNTLLEMPKKLYSAKTGLLSEYALDTTAPIHVRLPVHPIEKSEWHFEWKIEQSAKRLLKLTLHFMEKSRLVGVLRIDFNGIHWQPADVNEHVPEELKMTAGKMINFDTPHMHINVKGYKPLAWARPLSQDFPVQEITDQESILQAILAFGKLINLTTNIHFNQSLQA
ncbi:MAG: hypothetical protein IT252_01395 [Chitinophagaceae bacterium]|nr:hypothetical protein [Chitinophagaceae bacterium]